MMTTTCTEILPNETVTVEIDDIEQCHERLYTGCVYEYLNFEACTHSVCHAACCPDEIELLVPHAADQFEQCVEQNDASYESLRRQRVRCSTYYEEKDKEEKEWTKLLDTWNISMFKLCPYTSDIVSVGPWRVKFWVQLNKDAPHIYIESRVFDLKHRCFECLNTLLMDVQFNGYVKDAMWLPPACCHIEAQGKFRQGKNYPAKKALEMMSEKGVYEFGRFFDLSDPQDVTILVNHFNDWFHNVKLPSNVDKLKDFSHAWCHNKARKLMLDLLVHYGNRKAALLASALSGKLTQERYDNWNFAEPQYLSEIISVVWLFMAIYALYKVQTSNVPVAKMIADATSIAKDAVGSLKSVSDSANSIATVVSNVVDSLKAACDATLSFFKQMYEMIVAKINEVDVVIKELMKKLMKVLLVIIAFEFARTMFSTLYKDIKTWICQYLGFEDMEMSYDAPQAQGEEEKEGILHTIFEFVNLNFIKVSNAKCFEFLGKLPKMVSIAKALGWIFENLGLVLGWITEMWTGQPRPRTKLEMDISAFYIAVLDCKREIEEEDAERKYSEDVKLKVDHLELESKRLNCMVIKNEKMRPVFISRYNQAVSDLMKVKSAYSMAMKCAQKRAVPVWVYIYGDPGAGKSYDLEALKKIIWTYLANHSPYPLVEGPYHNGHLYQLNQDEEFFDGYISQLFTDIDDLFQSKDPDVRALNASRLINFVSPAPYALRVATVETKAHVYFRSRCILSTSNLNPEQLEDGQNLKLTDVSALTTRITIAVKKVKDSTGTYYVPSYLTPITLDGVLKKRMTKEELGSIIAEAIIMRESERHDVLPDYDLPKINGGLKSTRLSFTTRDGIEAQMLEGEKEEEEENEPPVVFKEPYKISEDERKRFEEFGSQRQWNQTQTVVCWKAYAYGYSFSEGFKTRLGLIYNEKTFVEIVLASGIEPANIDSPSSYLNKLVQEFSRRKRKLEARGQPKIKPREKKTTTFTAWKQSYEDKKQYVAEGYKRFKWAFTPAGDSWFYTHVLGMNTFFQIAMDNPGAILVFPEIAPQSLEEWFESHQKGYQWKYYPSGGKLDYDFWETHLPRVMEIFNIKERNWREQMEFARTRNGIIPGALLFLANFALIGYLTYKITSSFMPKSAYEPVAQAYDTGVQKTKKKEPSKRALKREGRRARLGPITKHSQGHSTALVDKALRNTEIIEVRIGDHSESTEDILARPSVSSSWCLFVYQNVALVPGHVMFSKGDETCKRVFSLVKNQEYHCTSEEAEELYEFAGDLILVRFPGIAAKADISRLFAENVKEFGKFMHILPHTHDTGCTETIAMGYDNRITEIPVNSNYPSFETDICFYGIPNEGGFCGTFYVHQATGQIVAIHQGGSPGQKISYAVKITKSDLDPFNPNLDILDPIPVHLAKAQALEGVQVLGVLPRSMGSFVPRTSSFRLSHFDYKNFVVPETEDGPAYLSPVEIEGKSVSPLNNSLQKFAKQRRVPPPKRPALLSDILSPQFNAKNVQVISIEEAIYGKDGYMKSIDMNTSAGYFFKKEGLTRRDLCYDADGNKRIHPKLRARVEQIIHAASKGLVVPVVFEETLKDEIKSKAKLDKVDTRLFSSGDFASLVVQRMYLGTFFVEFTKDPIGSPVGLTMNPHSRDWGLLYSRLRGDPSEKRKCGAGDFSSYDISLKNEIKEAFKDLVGPYFTAEEAKIVFIIIEANFAGWHIVGMLVFLRPWGTSSGSFITSMFNSFANWYLHKTAFISLYSEDDWKVVETTFTGDDSVFSVPEKYDDYNMAYLADFFRENHAMVYTSPNKTDEMTVEWKDLQYLKRNFVNGHAGIMAPLALRSIANMVKWTDVEQDLEVMSSVVNSVLLEAWHYGETFYKECFKWIHQEERRLEMNFRVPDWKGMQTLRNPDY